MFVLSACLNLNWQYSFQQSKKFSISGSLCDVNISRQVAKRTSERHVQVLSAAACRFSSLYLCIIGYVCVLALVSGSPPFIFNYLPLLSMTVISLPRCVLCNHFIIVLCSTVEGLTCCVYGSKLSLHNTDM